MAASKGLGQNGALYTIVDAAGQAIRIDSGRIYPGYSGPVARIMGLENPLKLTQQNAADLIAVLQPFVASGQIV